MRRRVASLLILCFLLAGCVNRLRPYNPPSQQKLRLQSEAPEQFTVQVADTSAFPVPVDGGLTVDIPSLARGCATYLFGIIKLKDYSAYDVPAIQVKRDKHTVRKLSLNDIAKLPVDEQGFHLLRID